MYRLGEIQPFNIESIKNFDELRIVTCLGKGDQFLVRRWKKSNPESKETQQHIRNYLIKQYNDLTTAKIAETGTPGQRGPYKKDDTVLNRKSIQLIAKSQDLTSDKLALQLPKTEPNLKGIKKTAKNLVKTLGGERSPLVNVTNEKQKKKNK